MPGTSNRPLSIAVLAGGQSQRMGMPKSDLPLNGMTLLKRTVLLALGHVDHVAIIGLAADARPDLSFPPADDARITYLQDAQEARGPIAGVIAAFDHDASCDWLVLACDMPAITDEAIKWLTKFHRPACTATLGLLQGGSEPEPMLAIYAPAARASFLAAVKSGHLSMKHAIHRMDANIVEIPEHLAPAWINVNTQEDWAAFLSSASPNDPAT